MAKEIKLGHLLTTCAIATALATTPYVPSFDLSSGFHLDPSHAYAKDGEDDDDDDGDSGSNSGSGGGGSDDDDDDGDSGSNSGSGGGGGDDDDDDDHSGSGSSGSDDDDDDDDDDRSSSSGGDDDDDDGDSSSSRSTGGSTGGGSASSDGSVRVVKIERTTSGVEVRYSDGTKEEIENGRYERKNAAGRTIEERPATGADISRLRALSNQVTINSVPSSGGSGSRPSKVQRRGDNIEVTYANGWKEEIEGGVYELKDSFNRTVVERPATSSDRQRLLAIAGS
jgi:hypothetical protein